MSLLASTAMAGTPNGSQHARVGELAEIQFSLGSAKLPVTANRSIGEIAAWAKANPTGYVVLDSHASGQPQPSTVLALHRGEAVRDQLISLGVDPDQLVVAAFADNADVKPVVAVWATRQPLEKIVAARRNATAVVWGRTVVETRPQIATK